MTTRPRASDAAVSFYERNSSSYCGEFTDGTRQFFVLEAPEPPPPSPTWTPSESPWNRSRIRSSNSPNGSLRPVRNGTPDAVLLTAHPEKSCSKRPGIDP